MVTEISVRIRVWRDAEVDAMRVREAVFIVEQGVPPEIERDQWDARSDHALAFDSNGQVVATGRLLPDGHIGRMAVLLGWRKRGVGARILDALMERARERGMTRVALNAQTHAAPFYARHGFLALGTEFMEAGIPHVAMAREL